MDLDGSFCIFCRIRLDPVCVSPGSWQGEKTRGGQGGIQKKYGNL